MCFTRKERTGVLILIGLVLIVAIVPTFYPVKNSVEGLVLLPELQKEVTRYKTKQNDSSYFEISSGTKEFNSDIASKEFSSTKGELFEFDPNTLSAQGWKKLGLRARTIHTIQNYLSKGGRFMNPQDLKKIYGLHFDEYQKLLPFVIIKNQGHSQPDSTRGYSKKIYSYNQPKKYAQTVIEINSADTIAWISLPGIGAKLAHRIIHFRDKLGGFYEVDQVGETYGVLDSTFQKIQPWLTCNQLVKKININTAQAGDLSRHPYIRWNIANAIVNYRSQHGNFKSSEMLLEIQIITAELYKKICPYLTID